MLTSGITGEPLQAFVFMVYFVILSVFTEFIILAGSCVLPEIKTHGDG